ncbi:hypothetical protein B0J12DRAFT_700276 [Macrophomina phaseolina]|uniref:SnoaL-like domain-containing protein n=1 Tax=Macrophomina phaseolina TaxID=35725 RepID=A0ABQ8G9P0_9PEZI|nr:hypothetical protein B0J12DRAFT_700276 [Macrophomina phaseolina]
MPSAPEIKKLSLEIFDALIKGNFDSPLAKKHLSPNFVSKHADEPETTTLQEFITKWQTAIVPSMKVEVLDSVAEVEGDKGKVWIYSRLSGVPGVQFVDSVDIMEWSGDVCVSTKDVQRVVV